MRGVVFLVALVVTFPALAKDITVTLTDADQQVELAALDAYVKAGGLSVATAAVLILQKLQAATQAPDTSAPTTSSK